MEPYESKSPMVEGLHERYAVLFFLWSSLYVIKGIMVSYGIKKSR